MHATETTLPDNLEVPARPRRGIPVGAWAGLLITAAVTATCWALAGAGLSMYFGGVVFAALLIPPLVLSEDRLIARAIIAAAVCDGIAIVWLAGVAVSPITLMQWLLCYAVLVVWCFALLGLSSLAARLGFLGSAIVVLLAMLWLAAPVWSARYLLDHQELTSSLVGPHPLFAINGQLKSQGIWSERPIAYRFLFTLGQDVPYELPRTIWPMAVVHLAVAGVTLMASRWVGRR